MYVLKFSHPEYSGGYCVKGWPYLSCQDGCFNKHEVFATEQEAQNYIPVLLDNSESGILFAPDITETNFEVVEVKQYEDLGPWYYTEKEAKNMREAI